MLGGGWSDTGMVGALKEVALELEEPLAFTQQGIQIVHFLAMS